jgi:hypothetical protein
LVTTIINDQEIIVIKEEIKIVIAGTRKTAELKKIVLEKTAIT